MTKQPDLPSRDLGGYTKSDKPKQSKDTKSFTCSRCGKTFKPNPSRLNVACAVLHPEGQCCHYSHTEVNDMKLNDLDADTKGNSESPSSPQDTPIKDIDQLFDELRDEQETSDGEAYIEQIRLQVHKIMEVAEAEAIIADRLSRGNPNYTLTHNQATQAINQLITRSKIDELETLLGGVTVPDGHFGIVSGDKIREYLQDRITNLKESLNE